MSSVLNCRVAVLLAIASLVLLIDCSCSTARPINNGRKIIVGGEENWHFGYNYSAWAENAGPFHVGDTLVFKYKPSVFNGMPVNHNVYQLHSAKAYENCNFAKSVMLADTKQGDPGFEYKLTKRRMPMYFACSIANGIHCNEGMMKFKVAPL